MNSKAFTTVGELLNIAISSVIVSGISSGGIEGKAKLPATSPSIIKAKFGLSSVNGLKFISVIFFLSFYWLASACC